MTARRAGLVVGLLGLALWGGQGLREARAQGMLQVQGTTVYQSEGRDPVTFDVQCTTAPWVNVVSSDTISRSTFFQAISSNTTTICLVPGNTSPAASVRCSTTTAGPELAPNSALTDYSRAAWWCAASSGTTTQVLKGYRTRDRSDYGAISSNRGN